MPPSQLRRLKSSLRDQGIVGPQKYKKQKRQANKNENSRIQNSVALQGIREQFNPFEAKLPSKSKYEFASNAVANGRVGKGAISRPGVTKGLGEENRRRTLLVEMQRRKKVGGMMDRRFGENDATMTPEERALERFVKEKQKRNKTASVFDLEDDEDGPNLTHGGKSLSSGMLGRADDFSEANVEDSEEDLDGDFFREPPNKRRRLSKNDSPEYSGVDQRDDTVAVRAERPKTKKEVMEEIVAKSKLHKYERQQAKEDDDDLRAELDKGLPDLFALMRGNPRASVLPQATELPNGSMNPDRMALLNGKDRLQADKEYDERLRQMAMDQRAKPTVRTLTDEEKAQQEAQRLKELEMKRLKRMRGEPEDTESDAEGKPQEANGDNDIDLDEENAFGLGPGLLGRSQKTHLDVEDEDDFVIEDDLIAPSSDVDVSDARSEIHINEPSDDDDDKEFVQGLLSSEEIGREGLLYTKDQDDMSQANGAPGNLAYTYRCPQTHEELLAVTKDIAIEDLPTVVQRIRALYHPKLASENRAKLESFAIVLVDHVSFLANQAEHPPFAVLESLIRHVHSLAKVFPENVGCAFRAQLKLIYGQRSTGLTPGDLVILTAIGSTFPTSDHYHQVVVPAMLCMSRYLGQKIPGSLSDLAMGTYVITLCLQYQQFSKRYVPEVVNYTLNTLWALSPVKSRQSPGAFPHHTLPETLRLRAATQPFNKGRHLTFWDVLPSVDHTDEDNRNLKVALINTHLVLIKNMAALWAEHSAFCEVFDPIHNALRFLSNKFCRSHLDSSTTTSIQETSSTLHAQLLTSLSARKFLHLHNHRPLAIKTSIPKFEDSYNPSKHYDPDRDRAELSKLKAEHKRERKGALRELRKDASFVAREALKEKKERDAAYEKKYKRLVAEVQGEEGREAKSYEREKRLRRGKR